MEVHFVGRLVSALLVLSQICHSAPAQSKIIQNCNLFNDVSEVNLKASENLMPEPWQIYKNDGSIKHGQLCPLGDGNMIDFDGASGKYVLYTYSKVFSFAPLSTGMWPLKDHSLISLGGYRVMAVDYGSGKYLMSDCSNSKGKMKISCTLTSEGTLPVGSVALYLSNEMMLIMNSKTGKYRIALLKDLTSSLAKGNLAATAFGTWLSLGQSTAVPGEDLVINIEGSSFKLYAYALTHSDGKGQPLLPISGGKITPHDAYVGMPDGKFMAYNKTGAYAILTCSAGQLWFKNPTHKYGNVCEELTRGSLNSDPRDESTWAKMSLTTRAGKNVMAEPPKVLDLSVNDAIPVQRAAESSNLVNLLQHSAVQPATTHEAVKSEPHSSTPIAHAAPEGFTAPAAKVVMVESHPDKPHVATVQHSQAAELAVPDSLSSEFKKDEVDLLKNKLRETRSELGNTEDEVDVLRKKLSDAQSKNAQLEKMVTSEEKDERGVKAKLIETENRLKAQVEANEKSLAEFRAREAEDKKAMEAEFAAKLQKFRQELASEFDHERNSISQLLASKSQATDEVKDATSVSALASLPLGGAPTATPKVSHATPSETSVPATPKVSSVTTDTKVAASKASSDW